MTSPDSAVRVWDLPTRLFHWTLAVTVLGSVVTAKIGGNATVWHFRFGYLVFALLAFRIVWGFVGGHWSRFRSFFYGPGALRRYLRAEHRPGDQFEVGHSPLGALSVLALLALLAVQVGTGLVADDEIASVGPLNRFVGNALAAQATGWHTHWGQWGLLALIGLHLVAIAFHELRRKTNLVGPMIRGDKRLPPGTPASADSAATRLAALALAAGCAAGVAVIVQLGS